METVTMRKTETKGDTVRRMQRGDFRAMDNGESVSVIIREVLEIDTLRAQASKMSAALGCHFSVNYRRGDSYAKVTRLESKPVRE